MTTEDLLRDLAARIDAEVPVPPGLRARIEGALAARPRRPRRAWVWAALSAAAALVAAAGLYAALAPEPKALANEVRSLGAACPDPASLLPPDEGDEARLRAVLDRIVAAHYQGSEYAGYEVTKLSPAPETMVYGDMVANFCGEAVEASTWVLQLHFPALEPSASLSQGQLFVTKTKDGWDVWFRYH
ncbi:MAG: hypothetical protein IRZ11_06870 [Clostridia bacterium]|nr:hypothetical protein [Clostridia bacterium]